MPQIREIRKRIRSISNTQKVTHAMELVAAAKMRRSQEQALASRPYTITLAEILAEVKSKIDKSHHLLLQENKAENQMIIIVSSDRGLAGGLNINLFREILREDPKNPVYVAVGKKATGFVTKIAGQLLASYQSEEKSPLDLARTLSKMTIDVFTSSQVWQVRLIYPHFESTIKQTPRWIKILPIELDSNQNESKKPTSNQPNNLLFEPSLQVIIRELLPHHLLTQIYQVLLEAKAAEHSARMVAMKNATDAAGDLIDDLTLSYNQARQEAITKELLDITTAQKAFE